MSVLVTERPMAYHVDSSRFPFVSARATALVNDDSALDASYDALDALLAREISLVALFDLRGGASSARRRQRLSEWQRERSALLRRLVLAMAVVVHSQLERGFVTAALWLFTPPFPLRVFTSTDEAETWLLAQMRSARPEL
jgi:hypothetical protein